MKNKILVATAFIVGLMLLASIITYVFVRVNNVKNISTAVREDIKIKPSATAIMNIFNSGDYVKALEVADAYLKENPNDAQVLAAKATILANKGSVEFNETTYAQQAIKVANQALTIAPNLPEALYARGYAYEIQNQFDKAIADYKMVLKNVSDNPTYLTQMGHVYDLKGEPEKAKGYYQKALGIDNNFGKALINMGRYEVRYRDKTKAKEYFEKSLTYTNNEIDKAGVYYSLGMLDIDQNKIEEAYKYMQQAVKTAPNYPQALIGRGWAGILLMTQEDSNLEELEKGGLTFQVVFGDVEKAVNINPNQTMGYVTLARMYLRLPNLAKKSLDYYDQALEVVDKDNTIMSNDKEKAREDIKQEKEQTIKLISKRVSIINSLNNTKKFNVHANRIVQLFHTKKAEAAGVWSGNCYIGDSVQADYCYDATSFRNWIILLNLAGHTSIRVNDYYYTCTNGSPLYLVACGTSNGKSLTVRPTANLCINSSVVWVDKIANDMTWNWRCKGSASAGNGSINCSASKSATCTGTRPAGSHICSGSNTGLASNTAWHNTDKDNCSSAGKCAYYFECTKADGSPGNPPYGANWCPNDNKGLTKDLPWQKVTSCTSTRKCEYTIPTGCGPADETGDPGKNGFTSTADVQNAGLCPTGGATEENFVDNSGLASGAGWTWQCSKNGNTTSNCMAKKAGVCTASVAVPSGGFTSSDYSDACQHGSFHSVHLDGEILKWTCGTDDHANYTVGSFDSGDASLGDPVPRDDIPSSSSCECKPEYQYTCVDLIADCTNHCGQTINQSAMLTKKDTHCFPNVTLIPTPAERATHSCPDKKIQCPPCGINDGESGTINETN